MGGGLTGAQLGIFILGGGGQVLRDAAGNFFWDVGGKHSSTLAVVPLIDLPLFLPPLEKSSEANLCCKRILPKNKKLFVFILEWICKLKKKLFKI